MNLDLSGIQWELVAPILLLNLIIVIIALIDCIKRPTLNGPKWLWILLILFITFFGSISYFIFGRRNH